MASRGLLASASQNAPLRLCRQCLIRSGASRPLQRRCLSNKVIEKRRQAEVAWQKKAKLIDQGKAVHLWDILKERGFVKDIAGTDDQIRELMKIKRIGAYVGIDPTASSLHIGHLLPLMALFWMYMHGFRAHTVVGGATAKVGDPTGRLQSRGGIDKASLSTNIAKIHYQLKRLWVNVDAQARLSGYEKEWAWERGLHNNSMWYNNVPFIEIVQRLFKGMRLGPMLSRETVKRRMTEGDGMSLDEFVYPLMQAWDWWHMFSSPKPIQMQIGGSDQYGNIISGIECIKYMRDHEPDQVKRMPNDLLHTPVGFTVPLLTDSSGAKFGKSAGNAVWLDRFQTSTFDLYGYFMRRPDADVEQLLKLFTFLPIEQINKIMEEHNQDPSKRPAQHALAHQVVTFVHSSADADDARARHLSLYARSWDSNAELKSMPHARESWNVKLAARFRPDIQLPESLILGKSISRVLYGAGLAESATEANRLAKINGAYIGGAPGQPGATNKGMQYGDLTFTPIKQWFVDDTKNFLIDGKILILRRGKHFIRIVEMISNEEWEASGKKYPGEPFKGQFRELKQALIEAAGGQDLNFTKPELESIHSEARTAEFKRRQLEDANEESPKLTFPERRQRGIKTNKRRHKTSVERALGQNPKKLAVALKLLADRKGKDTADWGEDIEGWVENLEEKLLEHLEESLEEELEESLEDEFEEKSEEDK